MQLKFSLACNALILSLATSVCGHEESGSITALLVVDVQQCFLPGGSLSVPANHIIPKINDIIDLKSDLFDEVIYSRDYHPLHQPTDLSHFRTWLEKEVYP